jgi:probable rRNA maturation factor
MSVEVRNESGYDVDEAEFAALGRFVIDAMHVHPQTDLSITLVGTDAMTDLHVQWMDEPGPTDVLSFPMDELRPGTEDMPTPPGLLGDIVLCPQVAETQAAAAKHSTMDELVMLTTHGLLHLLGFDHADTDEEREMFGLQKDLIVGFQVAERRRSRT